MRVLRFGLPLVAFIVIAVFLALGLKHDPRHVPSPLIDKPAPAFSLPLLDQPDQMISNQTLLGEVWLMNVWASWCAACKVEHPLLIEMASRGAHLVGLNYKDTTEEAMAWLASYHNPYQSVIVDADGRVGIDFGVYGVPETFLIDKSGRIRYKHIGPVEKNDADHLIVLAKQLEAES